MAERERTEAGTYAETVSLDAVRDVFDAVRGPVVTSSDVAEALECTTEAARQKLTRLYDRGELDKRKTGRTVVYWRIDGGGFDAGDLQGDPKTTLDESDESGRESDSVGSVGDRSDSVDRREDAVEELPEEPGELADDVREYLEANDLPPKTDHGRDVVIDVLRYLRSHETAKTGEIREALAPDHADRYSSEKAMWESVRRYLEDVPGIEKAGYGEWGYAGNDAVRGAIGE
jgi:hypothetical protein